MLLATLKEIRAYQWVKNILIFVPLLLSHAYTNQVLVIDSIIAFIAFSLCASSVYVINDLCDVESDRSHPVKKYRPIAAGLISPLYAKFLAMFLFSIALATAFTLNQEFLIVFSSYFLLTLVYSFALKAIAIIDVIILGSLYTLRVIAGVVVIKDELSYWLIVFSLFIFFSLALLKRFTELKNLQARNKNSGGGRGYVVGDLNLLLIMGAISSYIAVLVVALYIHDPVMIVKYSTPMWLWVVIPALLYWLSRVWLIANRGELNEDPVLFAVRDRVSYLIMLVCLFSVILAI